MRDTVQQIHSSLVLRDIRDILMEDIIGTLLIMNERSPLDIKLSKNHLGVISAKSPIVGFDNWYDIFKVTIKVVHDKHYYPEIKITETITSKTHSISLLSIDLEECLKQRSKWFKFRKKKQMREYLNDTPISIDLFEFVSDMYAPILDTYRFKGVEQKVHTLL